MIRKKGTVFVPKTNGTVFKVPHCLMLQMVNVNHSDVALQKQVQKSGLFGTIFRHVMLLVQVLDWFSSLH